MQQHRFNIPEKASISLVSAIRRQAKKLSPAAGPRLAGLEAATLEPIQADDVIALLLRAKDARATLEAANALPGQPRIETLQNDLISAEVSVKAANQLLNLDTVARIQTKKLSALHLDQVNADAGVTKPDVNPPARAFRETGDGVLLGIVDSGFDLSHPMFRDAGKLRVEALLDQTTGKEYTNADLEAGWGAGGARPGSDDNGHGTHVASIAGGTAFRGFEGVAPGARFLLVRTDFLNTDKAVSWVFKKAGKTPCVVNLSLGHHWGAHDGSSLEEQLFESLVGPGRVIVASAGNEREDRLHVGGLFVPSHAETVPFDVQFQPDGSPPTAAMTLWYPLSDDYAVTLVSPTGQAFEVPGKNRGESFETSEFSLDLARQVYQPGDLIQVEVKMAFSNLVPNLSKLLRGWQLRLSCRSASVGRLDGWMNNSGFAAFHAHPLVETARTIGLPATSRGCLAVASHASKTEWRNDSDDPQRDGRLMRGRSSPFSSLGPTRDGRWKPEISAPGQYVTAALADGSELSRLDQRAFRAQHLLTIEGTSMAAPAVTGAVALLLQKNGKLTPAQVTEALRASARHDEHTGTAAWTLAYGHGKLSIADALARV